MLLLVLQAKFHQLDQFAGGPFQQPVQALINTVTPVQDGSDSRSAEQAAFRAGVPLTDSVVIRVELITPARVAGLMTCEEWLQQKGFEEPGGVGQMPFRGAGVGHALQAQIFRLQRMDQRLTTLAHLLQLGQQHNVPTADAARTLKVHVGLWICWSNGSGSSGNGGLWCLE